MLLREDIDENSTVYIDASLGEAEITYRVEKNGGLVNANIKITLDTTARNQWFEHYTLGNHAYVLAFIGSCEEFQYGCVTPSYTVAWVSLELELTLNIQVRRMCNS
ncbi:uncharacterized protein LOC113333989 [Papaver somniferum]|uniref:uncharacterized protein LOC113333989 n=1 Tax=Papaver somniferum TaxID=3469 RepID=UPI000E703531|nr:uncharacterized protein LOC113333989 [Papaver somniferum]